MNGEGWTACGLTFREFERNAEKPLAGLLIETVHGQALIGQINEQRGTCDCCTDIHETTIVIRFRRLWTPPEPNPTSRIP